MILVRVSDVVPVPWKNGGGITRELLRLPVESADAWTLRISVADIDADGPFSPFEGTTRWFAVLSGAGVRLRFADRTLHLRPGDAPLRFDGADAPDCTLPGGSTRDLNVMVRGSHGDATVGAATFDDETSVGFGETLGFFALRAVTLHGASHSPVALPAFSLAWNDSPPVSGQAWRLEDSQPVRGDQEQTLPGYWIRLQRPIR